MTSFGRYPAPWSVEADDDPIGVVTMHTVYRIRDARGREVGFVHNETIAREFVRWRNSAPRLIDAARDILDLTERLRTSLDAENQR
jgi:hypothetical protein